MGSELCPKCLSPRNMLISKSIRQEVDPQGKQQKITTTSYHCEVCHSFVRSEESEEIEDDPGQFANSTSATKG